MKEVWCVEKYVQYEGCDLLSVHKTEKGAREEAERLCRERNALNDNPSAEINESKFSNPEVRGGYFTPYWDDVEFRFSPTELKD